MSNKAFIPEQSIDISLIWAMARNRVIGLDNNLPWHLPSEFALFRKLTLNKPVIMGRRTFQSIGCIPLPGRRNIILSRTETRLHPNTIMASNLSDAMDAAKSEARSAGQHEIMILGGADIYAQALPFADRLYMTIVDCEPQGDTWFPEFDHKDWLCTHLYPSRRQAAGDEFAYTHYRLRKASSTVAKSTPASTKIQP